MPLPIVDANGQARSKTRASCEESLKREKMILYHGRNLRPASTHLNSPPTKPFSSLVLIPNPWPLIQPCSPVTPLALPPSVFSSPRRSPRISALSPLIEEPPEIADGQFPTFNLADLLGTQSDATKELLRKFNGGLIDREAFANEIHALFADEPIVARFAVISSLLDEVHLDFISQTEEKPAGNAAVEIHALNEDTPSVTLPDHFSQGEMITITTIVALVASLIWRFR